MGVKRRDRIIHKQHVGSRINSARQRDSCLLATGQVDAFLANFSIVTGRHNLEIRLQLACHDGLHVPALFKFLAEKYIFAELAVLNPWLLLTETCRAVNGDGALAGKVDIAEFVLESALLTVLDTTCVVTNLFASRVRHVNELANHTIQKSSLACARRTNNDSKRALLNIDIEVLKANNLVKGAVLQGNLRLFSLAAAHIEAGLADLSHAFRFLLILFLLDLLTNLVLVSLVEFRRHSVGEVALDLERIFVIVRFLLTVNEACLSLGSGVELKELLHTLHQAEVLAVEVLTVVDPTLNATKHDLGESELLNRQRVAEVDVGSKDADRDGLRHKSFDEIIDFLPHMLRVLNCHFLLEDFVDFFDKIGLPAEQLDGLDIVEALIDIEASLLFLAALLFTNLRLCLRLHLL